MGMSYDLIQLLPPFEEINTPPSFPLNIWFGFAGFIHIACMSGCCSSNVPLYELVMFDQLVPPFEVIKRSTSPIYTLLKSVGSTSINPKYHPKLANSDGIIPSGILVQFTPLLVDL